ncbi:hypothetical protein P7B02_17275 [Caulobacter segnis]|uniref:hypothetical protein n=1 Tax=Caulobacter segnis TaxID=88688 RepID=UPI0024105DF6|nr:hypothetical protein [Caulobacter segnis]MDG2523284.1 hypothetical protein [Caulobacter segnis]
MGFNSINLRVVQRVVIWAAVGAVWVGTAATAALNVRKQEAADRQEAARWSVDGEPCPVITEAAYDAAPLSVSETRFYGMKFERRVGHVMCTRVLVDGQKDKQPVCQFTGPVFLRAEAAGKAGYYAPGQGKAARVAMVDGKLRCAMVPKFKMFAEGGRLNYGE